MANLGADANYAARDGSGHPQTQAYRLTNALQIYAGSLVGIVDSSVGYLALWADSSGMKFKGLAMRAALGNTSASPIVEAEVNSSGPTIYGQPVTGASTIAHVGRRVYCSTDNLADLTLTPTTNVNAIGAISRFNTATSFDIQLFSAAEYEASLAGVA